mgnify:FL=1
MPKIKLSDQERMNRELLAALRGGQARLGERDIDTAEIMPNCQRTYYLRLKSPEQFTVRDLRILAKRYKFTDYQLCQIFGVAYQGNAYTGGMNPG